MIARRHGEGMQMTPHDSRIISPTSFPRGEKPGYDSEMNASI